MMLPPKWGAIAMSIIMTLALLALIPFLQNAATSRAPEQQGEKIEMATFTPEPPPLNRKQAEPLLAPAKNQLRTQTEPNIQTMTQGLASAQPRAALPAAPVVQKLPPPPDLLTENSPPWEALQLSNIKSAPEKTWAWTPTVVQDSPVNPTISANAASHIERDLQGDSLGQLSATAGTASDSALFDTDAIELYRPAPAMPTLAKLRKISGTAEISFIVNEKGECSNIVVQTEHNFFETACLETMKTWKFQPALKNGHPIAVPKRQTIIFSP